MYHVWVGALIGARRVPGSQRREKKHNVGREHSKLRENSIRNNNRKRITHGRSLPDRLLFTIPIAVSLLISHFLFAIPEGPGETAMLLLVYAGTACFSALLFLPIGPHDSAQGVLVLWRKCTVVVLIFMIAVLADSQTRAVIGQTLPLAFMLFLVLMAALGLVLAIPGNRTDARQIVFMVLTILFAMPVWLGPLAEQMGHLPGLPNWIIGASPLSAFAVSLDIDYLWTSWFYKHSVMGSLRHEYLSWSAYVLIFTIMIAGFAISAAKPDYKRIRNFIRNRVTIS